VTSKTSPVRSGVLANVDVLDLSWGISGPIVGMLLGDHGARVTRIEAPRGAPFEAIPGDRVWSRGKRRAALDLRDEADRAVVLELARRADVVIESFGPGVAATLGVGHATLLRANPRLVYCSITGYGDHPAHAGRPAYDALVAARTGQQFESRGVVGTTIGRLAGTPILPDVVAPPGCAIGAQRGGPLFSGVPWISLATAYNASVAINAALYAREITGRGQRVHTSMLQGALATLVGAWQRVEHADRPGFNSWIFDPRAPKGFFAGSDGQWMHHWLAVPSFILGTDDPTVPSRLLPMPEGMAVLHDLHDRMIAGVAAHPTDEWVARAAVAGVCVQPVRSPEAALADPEFERDGSVVEVDGVRMVGHVYGFEKVASPPIRSTAAFGAHTEEVRAETATPWEARDASQSVRALSAPLDGVLVLDLGLAVAGPFGTQLLADLGATVIKVNNPVMDEFFLRMCFGMSCNRGKQSIAIDLKRPEGMEVLFDLVRRADVVQHNMRYDAAERLGIDYESLRVVNPSLIYCHTRGHDTSRVLLPGNDQTAAALAGTSWMEGGVESGNVPIWPNTSLGDTGNGFLSAVAILQALRHRLRTGEGQFVHTSIVNAHLLNASMVSVNADGTPTERPRLDADQLGWGSRYRLHETSDGWLCVALVTDEQAARFDELTRGDLKRRSAREWFDRLDAAGVPCEVADPDFVCGVFDDPELIARNWVTTYDQALVGRMDVAGLLFDLDDTPGRIQGPPISVGEHSRAVLRDVGYDEASIEALIASGAVTARD
jgi:crotonobetainyl-CoA:carnitine CoA-transferase CaiB-like acyl-CoA transferase